MSMTIEARQEVEKFLRAGERLRAVQYLNNTFNISLQDAELLVAALEQEIGINAEATAVPATTSTTTLDGPLKAEVTQLLQTGRKLDAVKSVRKNLHVGLKEALVMVEEVAREANPNYVSFNLTGCLQVAAKGLGIFLMIVSIMFLAAAGIIYYLQEQSISNSDRVSGEVTEMKTIDTGGSAPVVSYEWSGKRRTYESNYYASPPDYQVGQTVSLYVNRDDPDDILIDTFVNRYALIVGLLVPGAVLLLISIGFLYFAKRKF
ncbi:MAG: DUF3592 domain-containing protein [Cyclobacteriaceae bacterium]